MDSLRKLQPIWSSHLASYSEHTNKRRALLFRLLRDVYNVYTYNLHYTFHNEPIFTFVGLSVRLFIQ